MGDIKEEKRKSVRIKKTLFVRYSYSFDKDKKRWEEAVVRDISETGISITTCHSFLPNDTITILIKIPSRPLDWIELKGRVVRCEGVKPIAERSKFGASITAIEFIDLNEEQKKIIREYISWFLSKPY